MIRQSSMLLLVLLAAIAYIPQPWLRQFQSGWIAWAQMRTDTSKEVEAIISSSNTTNTIPQKARRKKKVVTFVHFHKAGGTSLVKMFTQTMKPWRPSKNGNPWGVTANNRRFLIPFWRYDKPHLDMFLTKQPQMQFLAMEWNFFTSLNQMDIQSTMELVTCMREPYSRFVSNLFFNGYKERHRQHPMWWATKELTWSQGMPDRPKENDFPVNYNKPNYYVAFLNGLADKQYSWMDLNQTHLDIAKERLHWFSGILILELPDTHGVLKTWLPQTEKLEHRNRNDNSTKHQNRTIAMTREEFNMINSLDVELYEYAVNLTLSRLQQQQ